MKTVYERLHEKIAPSDNALGCWKWTAATYGGGYGVIRVDGKTKYAHRVSYEVHFGKIPSGMEMDHLCRNRWCVNPGHVEPVTKRENVLRGSGHGAKNANKTSCPSGHPYSGDNLYFTPIGNRRCRRCNRERMSRTRN